MNDELKPCPFCGGEQVEMYSPFQDVYRVVCICGACGALSHTQEKAAAAWNRRYDDE